jgi:hypothetical protein
MKEFPLLPIRLLGLLIGIFLLGFENNYIKLTGFTYVIGEIISIIYSNKLTNKIRIFNNIYIVLTAIFLLNQIEIKKNKFAYSTILLMFFYDIYLLLFVL